MKTYSVFFTADAEHDLEAIYDYIALEKDMPDVAWILYSKTKKSVLYIGNSPFKRP